jgi:predicted transcriptional regulator
VNDGISYIPVVGENKVIGTLTDLEVLKAWEKGDGILDPETPVEKLMSEKVLPEVRADLSIEEVRKVMLKQKTLAVLVLHAGLPQGILTRFDLLEHVGTDM